MNIAIVTPWFDHVELADDYFEATLPELEDGDESIIVDNGSLPPLPFGILRAESNVGFCAGSNFGLRRARADAVLFLNNDVALGRRGWLSEIREALEPGVLVGSLRYDAHADVDGAKFPYLDGWCLAGMRADLLELGGFDETLQEPAYYSDNILCLSARERGMTLREVQVGLHHKESTTSQPQRNPAVQAAARANREVYTARVRAILAVA
jgi:GT2 family glycosyltransferase